MLLPIASITRTLILASRDLLAGTGLSDIMSQYLMLECGASGAPPVRRWSEEVNPRKLIFPAKTLGSCQLALALIRIDVRGGVAESGNPIGGKRQPVQIF